LRRPANIQYILEYIFDTGGPDGDYLWLVVEDLACRLENPAASNGANFA
jgi:hypothetical protein